MSKLTVTSGGSTAIALATATVACAIAMSVTPASALTGIYSGGATFPEKTYRDGFNCYGNTSGGETTANLPAPPATCNSAAPYNGGVEILYLGVGSGNGLNGYRASAPSEYTHNSVSSTIRKPDNPPVAGTTDLGSFYGTGVGTGWVADGNATNYFPTIHFSGSDDPLTKTQLYGTVGALPAYDDSHWGHPIQFPTLVGAVTLPYHPTAGWTEAGAAVAGNDNKLKLSTNSWCGIFTGAITDWNSGELTADNGGVSLTGGVSQTIYAVYRSDGSGTTFLFSNALINQCAASTHPVPSDWNSAADNSFFAKSKTKYDGIHGAGSFDANFPTLHAADAGGSGGVKSTVLARSGSIGYVSPDFVNLSGGVPDSTGPAAANLQTWQSFGGTKVFIAPTVAATTAIMKTAQPPSFTAGSCTNVPVQPDVGQSYDGICAHNALNWSFLNPKPLDKKAYPIGGFTYVDMYDCYASAADRDALASKFKTKGRHLGLWRFWFGSANDQGGTDLVLAALTGNGFAKVPPKWASVAKKLLTTDKFTTISAISDGKAGCAGVSGGH